MNGNVEHFLHRTEQCSSVNSWSSSISSSSSLEKRNKIGDSRIRLGVSGTPLKKCLKHVLSEVPELNCRNLKIKTLSLSSPSTGPRTLVGPPSAWHGTLLRIPRQPCQPATGLPSIRHIKKFFVWQKNTFLMPIASRFWCHR